MYDPSNPIGKILPKDEPGGTRSTSAGLIGYLLIKHQTQHQQTNYLLNSQLHDSPYSAQRQNLETFLPLCKKTTKMRKDIQFIYYGRNSPFFSGGSRCLEVILIDTIFTGVRSGLSTKQPLFDLL